MKKVFIHGVVMLFALLLIPFISAQEVYEEVVIEEQKIRVKGTIEDVITYERSAYIVGNFTTVSLNDESEVTRKHFVEISLEDGSITDWNLEPDTSIEDAVLYGDDLLIGGHFRKLNTSSKQYVASLDLPTQGINNMNFNVNGPVYAMEVVEDVVFVGGGFSEVNGEERNHIASYNVSTNTLLPWAPDVNDNIFAMALYENTLYVGGSFTFIDGAKRERIAAFDLTTSELLPWNPQIRSIVRTITVQDENVIIIGYIQDDDQTISQQVTLQRETGSVISEISITPVPTLITTNTTSDIGSTGSQDMMVDESKLGFKIPSLGDLLTFAIRGFFVISGLAALFFMLMGAFSWVTSGGDADSVGAARDKIQSAVVGLLMIVAVLSVVWTLEQVIFNRRICLGVSCPVTIPSLLEPS